MKKLIACIILSIALWHSPVTQPAQAQFFCGNGFAYVGTFLWWVPQTDLVFQFSFVQLDFCGGLLYDPYVYGELYSGNNLADVHDSRGRSWVIAAKILNLAAALPSTLYTADGYYFIIYCEPIQFRPDAPESCYYYFLAAERVQGYTPACIPGSAASGMSPNFLVCPGASPTPTPTPTPPTVKVTEVGFTGDFTLTKWKKNAADRVKIDYPDGSEPTWRKRGQSNPDSPVAYKRGTHPTMFATFEITPAQNVARTAQIRVMKDNAVVATKNNVSIGGGMVTVSDIAVTGTIEVGNPVRRGEYNFAWEVSFDGGTNWAPAGTSGKHKIYWTYDTPLSLPFKTIGGNECFPTGDGLECNTLYDEALKHSVGEVGDGSSDLAVIIDRINRATAADFIYDPCKQETSNEHPLKILNEGRSGQCSAQANLLRGLLRSIGIDAITNYYWGGDPSSGTAYFYNYVTDPASFQVKRRANNDGSGCAAVEQDPHFKFHAAVSANNALYDPSFGLSSTEVDVLEASKYPDAGFFLGSDANTRRVQRSSFMSSPFNTNTTCSHHPAPGNLSPNPIDDAQTFVRQQYRDFLNREPDQGGLDFWTGQITSCNGAPQCIDDKRVVVSREYFLSAEFQERGYFVHRFYKAGYGRRPLFAEFLTDLGRVGFRAFTATQLENNKQNFADDWIQTDEFLALYAPMTDDQYVDALFTNAGITPDPAERAALIAGLAADTETRATALRKVVDNSTFVATEFNQAFVLMQYFGYLRRNPDQQGYDFWVGELNAHNDQYGMVRAFVISPEYRSRFGLP